MQILFICRKITVGLKDSHQLGYQRRIDIREVKVSENGMESKVVTNRRQRKEEDYGIYNYSGQNGVLQG